MLSGQPRKEKGWNSNAQGNAAKNRTPSQSANAKIDNTATKYNPVKAEPNLDIGFILLERLGNRTDGGGSVGLIVDGLNYYIYFLFGKEIRV